MIEVRGLTKSYGDMPVLRGIDIKVAAGTVFALLGPNGAGKTTAVRILCTLIRPDAGTAIVAGHDVLREPRRVQTAEGELRVELPQVRQAAEPFVSKLFPRGTKLLRTRPCRSNWANQSQSFTSVLRPGTFLMWEAFTRPA